MKCHLLIRTALLSLLLFGGAGNVFGRPQAVSYQAFYRELSPYGQWVSDAQYGYVWVPDAGRDFRPYYTIPQARPRQDMSTPQQAPPQQREASPPQRRSN